MVEKKKTMLPADTYSELANIPPHTKKSSKRHHVGDKPSPCFEV
jgi:hypothetical protein